MTAPAVMLEMNDVVAGYGEEVDFCMRAARKGFRNVLAGDVFVLHVGEVSFKDAGVERRQKAQATVDALYPEFRAASEMHALSRFRTGSRPRPARGAAYFLAAAWCAHRSRVCPRTP